MLTSLDVYLMHYPPSVITQALSQLLPAQHGVRTWPMPPERMHMTVQKLGCYLPEAGVPAWLLALTDRLDGQSFGPSFDVSLDVLQSRDPQASTTTVELTGRGAGVAGVRRLCRQLAEAMVRIGFPAELIRRRTLPHVTLDYCHTPMPARRIAPLTWRFEDICLVVSRNGEGAHRVLKRWQLVDPQQSLFAA